MTAMSRRLVWVILAGFGLLLSGLPAAPTAARAADRRSAPSEYEVKAAYLYNFTKFIEWPAAAFTGLDEPLVIGVAGENPFGSTLDDLVRGKSISGHPLAVRICREPDDFKFCHLLFVRRADLRETAKILAVVRQSRVVTVGETAEFARLGGTINFVLKNDRVGLEINRGAAQLAGARISSRLLNLATIVKTDPKLWPD